MTSSQISSGRGRPARIPAPWEGPLLFSPRLQSTHPLLRPTKNWPGCSWKNMWAPTVRKISTVRKLQSLALASLQLNVSNAETDKLGNVFAKADQGAKRSRLRNRYPRPEAGVQTRLHSCGGLTIFRHNKGKQVLQQRVERVFAHAPISPSHRIFPAKEQHVGLKPMTRKHGLDAPCPLAGCPTISPPPCSAVGGRIT
jgi:hypothetical protein